MRTRQQEAGANAHQVSSTRSGFLQGGEKKLRADTKPEELKKHHTDAFGGVGGVWPRVGNPQLSRCCKLRVLATSAGIANNEGCSSAWRALASQFAFE